MIFLLSACSNSSEENKSLVEMNSNIEKQLQESKEKISEAEKGAAISKENYQNLQEDYEKLGERLSDYDQIIKDLTDALDNCDSIEENKEGIDFTSDLSTEQQIIWTNKLKNILYFIPDFVDAEEIDKTKLLEGVFLYGAYEEKLNLSNDVKDELLDEICLDLFGKSLLVHQNFEIAEYRDGQYYAQGFSYHENRLSYVNKVVPFADNEIIILQQFSMSESEWFDNNFQNISEVLESLKNETFKPKYLGEYIVILSKNQDDKTQLKMKLKLTDG
jgi:chaperonin cofactor prefoldin